MSMKEGDSVRKTDGTPFFFTLVSFIVIISSVKGTEWIEADGDRHGQCGEFAGLGYLLLSKYI
ncbi:hypothetical protein [Sporolactobacillus nakayamae]|uniref:hypothetical protein n=1 Tax=Sporolactobacillus nakayamae TaxID=269670 RepID=UPI0015A518C0|nr:hypothetical protein [Sporolactobacillus nakayamae]